jgi:diaminohydroxyphosphoribosylaminopyrimidine deaminase/5-amino-6-(5-phosphoribosylamino)uracil reductase
LWIPLDSKVLMNQSAAKTLIAATPSAPKEKLAALKKMGIEVLTLPPDSTGRVDLKALLKTLAQRQISSVLVEGGAEVITSFLRLALADKIIAIIAPRLMGAGTDAVGKLNIIYISQTLKLNFTKVYRSGEDIVVEGIRI